MTNTKQKSAPKAPTHRAFHVREGKNGGKGFWTPMAPPGRTTMATASTSRSM